jgi:hypothetical protein
MNKRTKRNKNKKRMNKTKKYFGGNNTSQPEGIFDFIGNKLSSISSKAMGYASEKGLRLLGLQKVGSNTNTPPIDNNNNTPAIDNNTPPTGITGMVSKIGSDVVNVADKTSSALIGQVNDVLESPRVGQGLTQAAQETGKIVSEKLEDLNRSLNTPEIKQAVEKTFDTAADYAEVAVQAMDKPINEGIDELNKAEAQAISGVGTGIVKVASDMASEIPGVGAVVALGKMANDGTAAVGKVVNAASKSIENVSDIVEDTTENIKEGLDKLNDLKDSALEGVENKAEMVGKLNQFNELNKEGKDTFNRVNSKLDTFNTPTSTIPGVAAAAATGGGGGRKTRRSGKNGKAKSKRVRFAI